MGRPKCTEPRVRKSFMLPSSLAQQIELMLYDPVKERARYGNWSQLIERLLREWLDKQTAGEYHVDS